LSSLQIARLRPTATRNAILGALTCLLLTGCSGSGSSSESGPSPSTGASASSGATSGGPASASPGAGSSASAGASAAPTPASLTPLKVPAKTRAAVRAGTVDYVGAVSAALGAPKTFVKRTTSKPAGPMVGTALGQLTNQSQEYVQNGWHVVGRSRVVRSSVVGRSTKPPTLTVAACLDNSAVRVVDRSGKKLPASAANGRTLNILTLVLRHGEWVVANQSFPDDPDC
jgi:hypothetical protein